MKRIVEYFGLAGAIVPVLILIVFQIELLIRPGELPFVYQISLFVWPSSFLFWMTPRDTVVSFVTAFAIHVQINVVVYAFIGVIIKYVFGKLKRQGVSVGGSDKC